ncbi:MAG TPA: 50S ribosomal protein L25/general stress protein Ctc [Candidatus Thioglobus sp.]|jgi:large subunit ribosomal protein L25|nr:50S ribosomal protein L25/general stress protein Ctc [Candidatus Thioglobus sp.]
MSIIVNATTREDKGKGASRRLRREEMVPGIVYGGKSSPESISINFHELTHLLDGEDAFTSVLDLVNGKNKESVVIKDLQRHPAKNIITHIDFLRVDAKHAIVTITPIHFIGEEDNEALRIGGMLNKFVVSIEISCLPKDLPHGIDVDVSGLEIGDHISLTGLTLPPGVVITSLQHGDIEAHDQTVVSVSEAKIIEEEDIEDIEGIDEAGGAEGSEDESSEGDKSEGEEPSHS